MSIPGADVGLNPTNWGSATTYAVGDTIIPNPPNGHIYRCTTAGTTDTASPTFPTTTAGTVNDGTAVWTEAGSYPPVINSGSFNFDGNGKMTSWTDAGGVSLKTIPELPLPPSDVVP